MRSELVRAIREISETNPLARKIVNRSFSGFESIAAAEAQPEEIDGLIAKLLETIEYQASVIDKLSEHFEVPYDPEGVNKFKKAMYGVPIPMLCTVYNRTGLQQYRRETRFLIVTALIDLANESKKTPSELWVKVFANNGDFGD